MASKELEKFEKIALDKIGEDLKLKGFSVQEGKSLFREVNYDAVFLRGKEIAVVEVALGGGTDKLKPGPERKMKTDVLKLISSPLFLRDTTNTIVRRIIIVRKGIEEKINKGWLKTIASTGLSRVEFIEHDFQDSEGIINEIRLRCTYEKAEDDPCTDND